MKFPHAYKGVKLIFIAELVSIVTALVALIAAIFTPIIISGNGELTTPAAVLVLISGIASIVVFVIQLCGLFFGAKDSRDFRIGLWVTFVGIVAGIVYVVLGSIEATKGLPVVVFALLNTIAAVADFVVIICILFGISTLASQLGYSEMEEDGRRLAFYIIILYIISLLFGFMPGFNVYVVNTGWRFTLSIFGVIATVLEIIVFVSTILYLHRATKMLEE